MASAWAKDLPLVKVSQGQEPKRVTLIAPYYECPQFFQHQMRHWITLSVRPELLGHMAVTVVDDGSSVSADSAVASIRASGDSFYLPRLFRIGVDVPWNWLAARNIGAHHAEDGWLLLTDMDHVVPYETMQALVYGQHDQSTVYAFRRREHTGEEVQPHSASFFMTREMFWKIGGYDEELSGRYGTDGDFRRRAKEQAPFVVLTDYLVRHEYVGDSSTTRYARKLPEDYIAVKRIVDSRRHGWKPRTLSFPYQEVTCSAS